jgi:predicted deacylase
VVVPWSRDRSAYGQLVVPVTVLQGGPGPSLLITAGVHGDEYEGQIVLPELARDLDPASLRGRVILVPRANPPAARAGSRTSPVDGGNLARLFPGEPGGSLTAALAAAITHDLLPLADAVLDLHAGGTSLEYVPCAWGRLTADVALARGVLDMMLAFGAPVTAVTAQPGTRGTLVAEALAGGRLAMAAELGGGGAVTPASLAVARRGCRLVLAHLGIIEDAPTRRPGLLSVVEPRHFLRSPGTGLFEPLFTLGDRVSEGAPAGRLHDAERPDLPPRSLVFPASGTVICRRVPAACEPGDVLLHLARETSVPELLAML